MKKDSETTIQELKDIFKNFVYERKWQKYHHPKDLAESICIEAAELMELFQWVTPEEALSWKENSSKVKLVGEELADIIMYCLSMANSMKIDVAEAVASKLGKDRIKYPPEKYQGKAHLQ